MPNHIKRFEEYVHEPHALGPMLNDLAEHIERLEGQMKYLLDVDEDRLREEIGLPPTDTAPDTNQSKP